MGEIDVTALLHDSMIVALKLCTPLLLASLGAGLLIGLVQAVTQISDSTLSFLPKLAATGAAAWLGGPFMVQALGDFMHAVFAALVKVGGQ